ncbi:hypothetical protein ACQCQL_24190, partial [Ralstonia pseudosolanacearum]
RSLQETEEFKQRKHRPALGEIFRSMEHAACLQCAAFAALAAALPVLAIFRLRNTRRWHFPSVGAGACALVFPVPVRSRDPPFSL